MDGLLCHREITPQQGLALLLINRGSVLGYALAVQPPEASITLGPISGRTYVGLSTLWPALAGFYDADASVVSSTIPRMSFQDGRVDVRHFLSIIHVEDLPAAKLQPPRLH